MAPQADVLEPRTLLSAVTINGREQYFIELVNRARQDPGAEAQRLGIAINEDYNLYSGAGYDAIEDGERQVQATHQILSDAAAAHSQDMLARNFFEHTNPDGESATDRVQDAGYDGVSGRENLALKAEPETLDRSTIVDDLHLQLWDSFTHRSGMLYSDDFGRDVEMGIGLEFGDYTADDGNGGTHDFDSGVVTQKYGLGNHGRKYITGVAYIDAASGANNDDFYSIGEGISGGRVAARNIATNEILYGELNNAGGYNVLVAEDYFWQGGSFEVWLEYNGERYSVGQDVVFDYNHQQLIWNEKVDFDLSEMTPDDPPAGPQRDDIVAFVKDTGAWWVARSNGTRLENIRIGRWNANIDWQNITHGDFDGDGDLDIYAWNPNGRHNVGIVDQDGMTIDQQHWGVWSTSADWQNVMVGDFNGDGKDDLVGRDANTGQWHVGISDGTTFNTDQNTTWGTSVNWTDIAVVDFDGDGNDDLIGRAEGGNSIRVSLSDGGNVPQFNHTRPAYWGAGNFEGVRYGDFNGDGNIDVVRWDADTGQVIVGESDGTDLTDKVYGVFGRNGDWTYWTVGDFNGDDADDIVAYHQPLKRWYLGTSTESGGERSFVRTQMPTWARETDLRDSQGFDIDGDGKDELIAREFDSGNWLGAYQLPNGAWSTRRVGGWAGGDRWAGVDFGEFLQTPGSFSGTASYVDTLAAPPAADPIDGDDDETDSLDALFADDDFVAGL